MKITGKVVEGKKLGRKLGFPTINIEISNPNPQIEYGVYSCFVSFDNQAKQFLAALNYGLRPTLNETRPSCEFHLLNFKKNISPKTATISLAHKIRNNIKFDSLDQLKTQIAKDIEEIEKLHYNEPRET